MAKKSTSLRISEAAKTLLEKLAKKLSISQTAIVELAIRKMAREEGISE